MPLLRVLTTTKATVSHRFVVDGQPADAAGPVTFEVRRLDGSVFASGTAVHGTTGNYSLDLTAPAVPDFLTARWTGSFGGVPVTVFDQVEIVGGFLFSLARARAAYDRMQGAVGTSRYTEQDLADARTAVEQEAERVAGHAFVPRFARYQLSGNDRTEIAVPDVFLRAVRAVSIGGVALTGADLTAVVGLPSGVLFRPGGWPSYPPGSLVVEYEHGMDAPPSDVEDAGILRLRSRVSTTKTSIPDRAISYTVNEGGVFRLGVAGARSTGVPEVDAAYKGYSYEGPV